MDIVPETANWKLTFAILTDVGKMSSSDNWLPQRKKKKKKKPAMGGRTSQVHVGSVVRNFWKFLNFVVVFVSELQGKTDPKNTKILKKKDICKKNNTAKI